jgi:hypothetical protein
MLRRSVLGLAALGALLALPRAAGQPTPFIQLTDGACEYRVFNIAPGSPPMVAGLADFVVRGRDHMERNWFWWRVGLTPEAPLQNQIYGNFSGNRARLIFHEPLINPAGTQYGMLIFDLEYTLSCLQRAVPGECERCELVIAIKVRNMSPEPVEVELFAYNNMDLNMSPPNDQAFIMGSDNQVQVVSDPGMAQPDCPVGAIFKVSSTNHVTWEIGPFPNLLMRLTDPVPSQLNNVFSPFGPGDYEGAQSWVFWLAPAGVIWSPGGQEWFTDEWVGSVVKEITIYRPGDVDRDCDVDLDDLLLVLGNFGLFCP